jgi:hypothetical protein
MQTFFLQLTNFSLLSLLQGRKNEKYRKIQKSYITDTLARDFFCLNWFAKWTHLGYWKSTENIFDFSFNFTDILKFKVFCVFGKHAQFRHAHAANMQSENILKDFCDFVHRYTLHIWERQPVSFRVFGEAGTVLFCLFSKRAQRIKSYLFFFNKLLKPLMGHYFKNNLYVDN